MKIKPTVFGLALSGGGHKGIAHAGVLQFLNEQKIFPEIISGTSAGSIVGALYANGKKPKDILTFFKSVSLFNWSHFSFRKAGFLDADQFAKYLSKEFGTKTIKELEIELYISATEIERGKLKIFHKNTEIVSYSGIERISGGLYTRSHRRKNLQRWRHSQQLSGQYHSGTL